jgi:hypothetical protein
MNDINREVISSRETEGKRVLSLFFFVIKYLLFFKNILIQYLIFYLIQQKQFVIMIKYVFDL